MLLDKWLRNSPLEYETDKQDAGHQEVTAVLMIGSSNCKLEGYTLRTLQDS